MEKLDGLDTPDLPTAPCRNTTPENLNDIATSLAVYKPEGDKQQQNYQANNNDEHPSEVSEFVFFKEPNITLEKSEYLPKQNANIVTAQQNDALRHDIESPALRHENESPEIASSDDEMSVDPPHAISQEIEYLLLQHEKCLISELSDALLRLPAPSSGGRKQKSLFTLPHSGVSPPPE
jgi:hypothetical protein